MLNLTRKSGLVLGQNISFNPEEEVNRLYWTRSESN